MKFSKEAAIPSYIPTYYYYSCLGQ